MNLQMDMCLSCDTLTFFFMQLTALHSQHATNMRDASRLLFLASGITITNPTGNT